MGSVVPGSGEGVMHPSLFNCGRMVFSFLPLDALFAVFILFKHSFCFNKRMGRDDELGLRCASLGRLTGRCD